jgi:hypothetical protein
MFYITKINMVLCVSELRILLSDFGILYVKVVEVTVMSPNQLIPFFQTVNLHFFICLDAMFVLIHK